jgi:hypothetical protein
LRTRSLFRISTRFGVFIIIAGIFIFLVAAITDDRFIIQNVDVPQSLNDAGYSGFVVANKIFEKLETMIQVERQSSEAGSYVNASELLDVNVDVIGTGVPIRQSVDFIRQYFDFSDKRTIRTYITLTNDTLRLAIKFGKERTDYFQTSTMPGLDQAIDVTVQRAAESVWKNEAAINVKMRSTKVFTLRTCEQ